MIDAGYAERTIVMENVIQQYQIGITLVDTFAKIAYAHHVIRQVLIDDPGPASLPSMHKQRTINIAHYNERSMALRSTIMIMNLVELKLILIGGSGMYCINSLFGIVPDYWAVCSGAWGYGLLCARYHYPKAFDLQ